MTRVTSVITALLLISPSCSTGEPSGADKNIDDQTPPDAALEPGVEVTVGVTGQALTLIEQQLSAAEEWDPASLMSKYEASFNEDLGYDPAEALNYDLIQNSRLQLTPEEEEFLKRDGFVLQSSNRFPTFSWGYHNVYAEDLPVYVTADSVLDALHRSYDDILKELELEVLSVTLGSYLEGMRARLGSSDLDAATQADVDFFLAVAHSLLSGKVSEPAVPGSFESAVLEDFVSKASMASGTAERALFGFKRGIDFSQFKPRGHYTDHPDLERYFRAMMWLGRIDLRLIETLGSGEQVLHRRQVAASFALRDLADAELRQKWALIDRVVTAFVGEHDYMTLPQLDDLQDALGIDGAAELSAVADEKLAQAIIDGGYGKQRIASHIIRKSDPFSKTLPLNVSFALFGQRYTVDSHVFSQVVYDRVRGRVVPNPLDVAFAALSNNQALELLQSELEQYAYAPKLGAMRVLIDAHPDEYWNGSLYTGWLDSIRQLSKRGPPDADATSAADAPIMPAVTQSEAWGRRLLNTQLASWAQLRHDTLLYAKQSYTTGGDCEFPDAYVDPYPAFWARVMQFADDGMNLVTDLNVESETLTRAAEYFERLSSIVGILLEMSEHQLTGMPHSAENLAFINDAVLIKDGGSGPPTIEGWYHRLLFNPDEFSERDNTIADVHTDVGGVLPIKRDPSVLHVGTGDPRLMVVTIETCDGPRAYAGPVFVYKEHLTEGFVRLTDEEWAEKLWEEPAPPDPGWMAPLIPITSK